MQAAIVHITVPIFYEFEGWLFEYDRRKPFGPWPLKKDFEPKAKAGKQFYQMFGRFIELPICEQDSHRV